MTTTDDTNSPNGRVAEDANRLNPRSSIGRRIIGLVAAAVVLAITCLIVSLRVGDAEDLLLNWGRLAPIPRSADHVALVDTKAPLTRSVRLSFDADASTVEAWEIASAGFRDAHPGIPNPDALRFVLRPASGAEAVGIVVSGFADRQHVAIAGWSPTWLGRMVGAVRGGLPSQPRDFSR